MATVAAYPQEAVLEAAALEVVLELSFGYCCLTDNSPQEIRP